MKRVLLLFSAVMLAGCTQSVDEMSYTQLQKYTERMVEKCKAQGVPQPQISACAEQEIRADQSRRMRQRQVGAALSQASANYGRSVQMNRPINCTSTPSSTWVGGAPSTVRTTCY